VSLLSIENIDYLKQSDDNEPMTFAIFCKIYDAEISSMYELQTDSIVYRFKFIKRDLQWNFIISLEDVLKLENAGTLEMFICWKAISFLKNQGCV
jgi:hypothetical protein